MQSINLPFETIEDLVRDGTYKLAVIRDSSKYHFLRSSNDSTLKGLTKLLLRESILPLSFQDALSMACQHEKLALYDRETIIQANTVKINCQLGQITTGQSDTIAMIMSKNSPFNFLINYQ
ncbi:uncharacterized protein LOC117170969 [Belonocnema kinseyi]|uniref:uncharacterized protein LOC117170969 n=1 Tax=Belonocnema kinseyi TaxID=2817044 RepID=UPI00143CEF4E|nr:uncharacterized protein LOC117170969 [Belonocnema kinseyi]